MTQPSRLNAVERVKVLIVDDHPAIREALTIRIGRTPDLAVCGEADDFAGALRLVAAEQPRVAIIDISLKSGDGIDLIKHIHARDKEICLLVWSMHSESLYAERALRAGAHGYITKEQATDQIIDAVRQVLHGKVYLSPAMTEKIVRRTAEAGAESKEANPLELLSDRELEVFRRIGRGQKTRAIAAEMLPERENDRNLSRPTAPQAWPARGHRPYSPCHSMVARKPLNMPW